MTPPPVPPEVAAVLIPVPGAARRCILALRALVFQVAGELDLPGLQETLKWGQPAYLPGRGGTTIRLGADKAGAQCKLMVHCQTTLVETWRARFADRLQFEGNRAILIAPRAPLPSQPLKLCIADALTYFARHRSIAHG